MPTSADDPLTALPLAGVRVVEIGRFASAPSCATVLADWGADVVKVEPLTGDPARGPGSLSGRAGAIVNPRFDIHNRSRRSLAVDLQSPEGLRVGRTLIGQSDVLVTNLRSGSLERLGLTVAALRANFPRLVVARVSGYGEDTDWSQERSYDHGAFWSYAGVASMFAPAGGEPPQPAGGFGDRAAGSMLAGAVCAALLGAARTGEGAYVTTSLVNVGLWLLASDVSDRVAAPDRVRSADRRDAPIPTLNCFRTADGHWLWLQAMRPDEDWPALLDALDAHWLDDDPRLHGGAPATLANARDVLIEAFDEIFRRRTLEEWGKRLSARGLTWSPVRSLGDVVADPQLRASTAFVELVDRMGQSHTAVNSPCVFREAAQPVRTTSPSVGEHTREVLLELGWTNTEIDQLAADGVVSE